MNIGCWSLGCRKASADVVDDLVCHIVLCAACHRLDWILIPTLDCNTHFSRVLSPFRPFTSPCRYLSHPLSGPIIRSQDRHPRPSRITLPMYHHMSLTSVWSSRLTLIATHTWTLLYISNFDMLAALRCSCMVMPCCSDLIRECVSNPVYY